MASIKLPTATFSEAPRTKQRDPQTEAILRIMGNNPIANSIETVGTDVTDALARRAKMRREAQEVAQLATLAGDSPDAYSKLGSTLASQIALAKIKHKMDLEAAGVKESANNYTPEQIKALFGDNPLDLPNAFGPRGVPQSGLTLFANNMNRKALDEDRNSNRWLREELGRANLDARDKDRYRQLALDIRQRDPVVKKLLEQDIAFDQADQMLSEARRGNTVSASALGIKMAKAMGEVGVMTDLDVVRYIQSKKLSQATLDKLNLMIAGKPTEATLAEIEQISDVLRFAYEKKIQSRYDDLIRTFAGTERISPESFADRVQLRYTGGVKKATMRWNPATGRAEPIQ